MMKTKRKQKNSPISSSPSESPVHQQDTDTNEAKNMFLKESYIYRWSRGSWTGIRPTTMASLVLLFATLVTLTYGQLDGTASEINPLNSAAANQHQEILVQPNTLVRIECRLPALRQKEDKAYYWNFEQSSSSLAKQHILYFERKPVEGNLFGIQLSMDEESEAYDLLINNATYELNDGLYHCYYRDESSKIDREFRLTVLIPPQPPTISSSQQVPAREGQEYQLTCQSHGGNPEPNITWYRNEQPLIGGPATPGVRIEQSRFNGTTSNTLTWTPIPEDNGASYKCLVWNRAMLTQPPHEREIRLQVEYAPRISLGPFNPLKVLEGQTASLTCLVDANPPVKGIRWLRDGQLIGSQFNHTIASVRIQDASIYSCQADNGIAAHGPNGQLLHGQVLGPASSFMSLLNFATSASASQERSSSSSPTAVEAQLQLQVLYPPRVQVKPVKSQPLVEGDSFALNCSVEAFPPASEFLWTKLDEPSFRRHISGPHSFLEFPSLSASDMGNYTCTATNRLEPSGYSQVLERQASGSALVQVRHKPGMAELVVGQSGETELNARTQIHCRARPPGFPEPQYKFWKYQGNGNNGNGLGQRLFKQNSAATYTIFAAKPEDEGKYGCEAFNVVGKSSEADADLIVNEPPSIIHDASARRNEDSRAPGDYPYLITVRATGKPEPKVSWFHRSPVDGRRIELSGAEMAARFKIDTTSKPENANQPRTRYNVVTTLHFRTPLELDDRGLYSVEFSNGLSRTAVEEFQLHISHAPVPAPRNLPVVVQPNSALASQLMIQPSSLLLQNRNLTKAGFELGDTVNITCRVSAHPEPTFNWYYSERDTDGRSIETNPRYRVNVTRVHDDIWENTLTFIQAQENDFGDYMCVAANNDPLTNRVSDSVQMIVKLVRKSQPEPPYQVEVVDANQDSVTLQWLSGFDGGFPNNHYLVQYAPDDGSGLALSKRFPSADSLGVILQAGGYQAQSSPVIGGGGGSSAALDLLEQQQQQQQYPRTFDCLTLNPCTISHLAARQAYVFRVRAKNELGVSEFSDELRASTRANMSQLPRILEAAYDQANNILHFRLEPGSDYPLNNLNARIEVRSSSSASTAAASEENLHDQYSANSISGGWHLHSTVPIREDRARAYLNMTLDSEQLRITLCSRTNEALCGPEYVVSVKSATSSFLQAERGLSSILVSSVTLIVVLAVFATTLHSCCASRKNKKADTIERSDPHLDNKPIHHHHLHHANGAGKTSHGSTTSTNSTSAGNGATGGAANGLQSMDSINNANGAHSDHSSDHSRQAKLDSMLPPNYNHYADRASILLEQQQQQQQQQQLEQQQQGLMVDKLGYGLPNSALLSVANPNNQSQQQLPSPMLSAGNLNYFGYAQTQQVNGDPQLHQSLEQQHQNSMLENGIMLDTSGAGGADQQGMWPSQLDDYSYNALSYVSQQPSIGHQVPTDHLMESAYGTTGPQLMMSAQSASYDNGANSAAQFHPTYLAAYQADLQQQQQQQQEQQQQQYQQQQQQRAQYQQEIANAQQQMYGTLTRNGFSNGNTTSTELNKSAQQQQQQQQQQMKNNQLNEQQYGATNGLALSTQITPPNVSQESDYGTTGGRSGRLIREIIV